MWVKHVGRWHLQDGRDSGRAACGVHVGVRSGVGARDVKADVKTGEGRWCPECRAVQAMTKRLEGAIREAEESRGRPLNDAELVILRTRHQPKRAADDVEPSERSSSVRTVSGGLPGLGRRR